MHAVSWQVGERFRHEGCGQAFSAHERAHRFAEGDEIVCRLERGFVVQIDLHLPAAILAPHPNNMHILRRKAGVNVIQQGRVCFHSLRRVHWHRVRRRVASVCVSTKEREFRLKRDSC